MPYKKQHYVPKMYLRQFITGHHKNSVYTYDIRHKYKEVGINNLCQKHYFYEYEYGKKDKHGDNEHDFEKALSEIESSISNFLRTELYNIENGYLFYKLSDESKKLLCFWSSFSFIRCKRYNDILIEQHGVKKGRKMFFQSIFSPEIYNEIIAKTSDSSFIIMLNKSSVPFITSEIPSVIFSGTSKESINGFMVLSPKIAINIVSKNAISSVANNNVLICDNANDIDFFNFLVIDIALYNNVKVISNNEKYLKKMINRYYEHKI